MAQIIYALVARDPYIVLSEFYKAQGNFPQITRNILPKLPRNGKYSYSYNAEYIYHYISDKNLIFMALAESQFPKRVAFLFLEDVQARFMQKYSEVVNTVIAFGVNAEFAEVLKSRMHFYNSDPSADKLMALRSSVDQVRNIMVENIDKVLQRGEKVELLVKKTEVMSEQAVSMRKRATALKRRMWVNNVKMYFICAVLILLGILTLSISVCGVTFDNC